MFNSRFTLQISTKREKMGCPYFEKNGICYETKTNPGPSYSLDYCSKNEEQYGKCAQFNLRRWKEEGNFDLRKIEATKYRGLKGFGSPELLRGIIRQIAPRVNKCKYCNSLRDNRKKGLCYIHEFYVQKTAYILQELHGFNSKSALSFQPMKHGPFSEEISAFLEGQEFLDLWSASKVDAMGQLGNGGIEPQEQGLFYKLIVRYLDTPRNQLEMLTTKHYELSRSQYLHLERKDEFENIISSLRSKYQNADDYDKEVKILKEPLTNTLKSISLFYEPVEPLSLGSSGILLKIRDKSFPSGEKGALRVLKFPRPRGGEFRVANLRIIKEEKDRLCSLSHERIVRVITAGETKHGNLQLPWYIMEHVGPSTDLEGFLKNEKEISFPTLISLFIDIASALSYLHKNEIIHCDLKAQNILVKCGEAPVAMITDLGYAHAKTGNKDDLISVRFSLPNAHPFLRKNITHASDPSAITTELRRDQLHLNFDLYALGKTLESVWVSVRKNLRGKGILLEEQLGKYNIEYLKLVIARLLATGTQPSSDEIDPIPSLEAYAPGIDNTVLTEELSYRNSSEVLEDLLRLDDKISVVSLVPELNQLYPKVINLGAKETKSILTERVKKLVNSQAFNRLGGVSQLGLINYVYPGAKHSRIEHALGSFAHTCDYIRALWYNSNTPLFKSIMRKEDLCAVLLAALLHDVGYYPMAHDLEDIEPWRNKINHKQYACKVIDESFKELISDDWGVNPEDVKRLIIGDLRSFREKILRSIIKGPIDTDTIDYLLRDGMHLGLPYPQCIDKEWLLRNLTIAYGKTLGKNAALAVTDKGRVTAESVAFSVYMMYSVAYWHHTVRSFKAMMKYAVERLSDGKEYDPDEHYLYFMTDSSQSKTAFQPPESLSIRKEIALSDLQQLLWLRERVDNVGKAVIDQVLERNLFKRLIALDSPDTEELCKFFAEATDNQIRQVREKLEEKLREWLVENGNDPSFKALEPLVLIDMPRMKDIETLYYVTEYGNTPLSQSSVVWKELAEKFSKSIGKVRIFVHPAISPILKRSLGHDRLIDILTTIKESPIGYQRG